MTATMTAEAPAALDEPARHPLDWLAAGTIARDRLGTVWRREDVTTPAGHVCRLWLALQPGETVLLDSADLDECRGPLRVLDEPHALPDDVWDWLTDPLHVRAAPGNSLPLDAAMCAFNRWAERVGAAPYASRRLFSRAVTRHGVERSQHGPGRASILHDIVLAEGPTR